MALKPEPTAPFHSVQYALRVLETVSKHGDGVTDTQISRETGLPIGHLTSLLLTLRREGYVEQVTDGAYVIGASLLLIGSGPARRQALESKLQQTLAQLRDSVGAAVYISRYVDGEIRVTQYADGPLTPAVNEWVDFRSAAHASAVGKCLLAQLDQNGRRDHISRHKTPRLTSRTITNEKVLFSKLDSQLYDGPGARPPGVRGRHGMRGGAADGRIVGGLPGAVAADRGRAPAALGGGHTEPAGGSGAPVAGALGVLPRPAGRRTGVSSAPFGSRYYFRVSRRR